MTDRPFRWGIIGPGKIAHRFAEALGSTEGAVLQAVASRSRERAARFAGEFGALHYYDSYEQLVADPAIDAVYIATPHNFHFEQTRMSLEAGKPVLCEKPFTVNRQQASELVDLAAEKNLFLMEALWTRYLPVYSRIRAWLDEGRIGELKLLSSTFGIRAPRKPESRLFNLHLAGGGLLDFGVYNIAVTQWILQRDPDTIRVAGYLGDTGVDELTSVLLGYDGGTVSQFTASTLVDTANDFHIFGTEGSVYIPARFWSAKQVVLNKGGQSETFDMPVRVNGFEYQIAEAMRCIREGRLESPGMTHRNTLANLAVMDSIRSQLGLKYPFERNQ